MRLPHKLKGDSPKARQNYLSTFLSFSLTKIFLNFIPLLKELTFYESSTKSLFDDFSVKLKTVALSVGGMLQLLLI